MLQIIEVKFEKFDVERDNYCRYDHVSIFNGAEINDAKRIGKYCGDSPPESVTLGLLTISISKAHRVSVSRLALAGPCSQRGTSSSSSSCQTSA